MKGLGVCIGADRTIAEFSRISIRVSIFLLGFARLCRKSVMVEEHFTCFVRVFGY